MILNLIVLLFVLAMAVMWATYGLFSALLHLVLVIVAGALAFALWEPVAYGVVFKFLPSGAWGVSLLGLFALVLLVLRIAVDRFVRGNIKVPRLADQIGGGALGLASGVLTAGITVIGLGFLPLPPALAGYQPYEVQSNGVVKPREGGRLWIDVDGIAASFFNRLSGGAFATGTPLVDYVPDVAQAASLFRLGRTYDENISVVSSPGEVTASEIALFAGKELPGLDSALASGLLNVAGPTGKLVSVTTVFKKGKGASTYDTDGILRMPATGIRLATQGHLKLAKWVTPLGFSKAGDGGAKQFYPLASNQIMATSTSPTQEITWHFVMPSDETPNFLLVRNTRVLLPAAQEPDGAAYALLIGNPVEGGGSVGALGPAIVRSGGQDITSEPSGAATRHKAVYIEQSNALPSSVSKNNAQFLTYNETAVVSGEGMAESGVGGRKTTLGTIEVSSSLRALRVEMVLVAAANNFGALAQGGGSANTQEISLSDNTGQAHRPFGYVLRKKEGQQQFKVLNGGEIRNNTDLPLGDIQAGDRLYVYWKVPPGITVQSYHIGGAVQEVGFSVN
ncbi:MAG: hypothetical protein V3V20_07545 [Algisphaera sp.]